MRLINTAGKRSEFTVLADGKSSQAAVNFYAPPAYDKEGEPVGPLRRMLGAIG